MVENENSSERKSKRVKVRLAGARGVSLPRPSSFFPRSPAARRTAPLTEGLEQATVPSLRGRRQERGGRGEVECEREAH